MTSLRAARRIRYRSAKSGHGRSPRIQTRRCGQSRLMNPNRAARLLSLNTGTCSGHAIHPIAVQRGCAGTLGRGAAAPGIRRNPKRRRRVNHLKAPERCWARAASPVTAGSSRTPYSVTGTGLLCTFHGHGYGQHPHHVLIPQSRISLPSWTSSGVDRGSGTQRPRPPRQEGVPTPNRPVQRPHGRMLHCAAGICHIFSAPVTAGGGPG